MRNEENKNSPGKSRLRIKSNESRTWFNNLNFYLLVPAEIMLNKIIMPGRENLHHVCRQEDVTEQEDRNNAKVSSQRRSLAEKQVIGIFLKNSKSTKPLLGNPQKIFE